MNWGRGLFRVWIVGSILWTTFWLWSYPWPLHGAFVCAFGLTDNPFCAYRSPYDLYPVIAFAGPIIAIAGWFAGRWALRGFSSSEKSN